MQEDFTAALLPCIVVFMYVPVGVPPLSGFVSLCRSLAFIPISFSLAYIFRGELLVCYLSLSISLSSSPPFACTIAASSQGDNIHRWKALIYVNMVK